MRYIGIDPGKGGAMAVLTETGEVVEIVSFDITEYENAMRSSIEAGGAKCVLEHVGAMPGQGVTSMFNFGMNFGLLQGLLTGIGIPFELVRPQKWKREFSITGDKNSSIEVCRRLFPDVSLKRTDRCKKDDDGIAEAILMAEYARRHL